MKNCPNCGSPVDPYRVKCEYCGTMYFDFAAWMMDGKPCYISYLFDNGWQKGTITALAIPRLETIDVDSDPVYIVDHFGNSKHILDSSRSCELDVKFRCVELGIKESEKENDSKGD